MSLQSALITIGVILIFAVYIISALLEKHKSKSTKGKSDQLNLNDKDEPSLLDLEPNDHDSDNIPILDSPFVAEKSELENDDSSSDDASSDTQARKHQPEHGGLKRIAEESQSPQPKAESQKISDGMIQTEGLIESDEEQPGGRTFELSKDRALSAAGKVEKNNSMNASDEPEDFGSEIDSLLEENPENVIDHNQVLPDPTFSADDMEDDENFVNQIDLEESLDQGLELLAERVAEDSADIPGKNFDANDNASDVEDIKVGKRSTDEDEEDIDPNADIPLLEISDQVHKNDDAPEADSYSEKVNDAAGKSDENNYIGISGASGERKPHTKIKTRLSQYDESEIENPNKVMEPGNSSNQFIYPKIPGFEKISQIDYWVKIHGDRDVGRESVLALYREANSSLTKISRIHGIKIPEKSWCDLEQESEDARFGDLIVTIQLADQHGSVDKVELTRFSELVSKLAVGTGRSYAYMAPIESALQQASAIDDFVRYYDSIFVINIKPMQTEYFEGNVINRCATQLGLERSENNYFVRNKIMGKRNVCLYSLANMSDSGTFDFDSIKNLRTRGVTFFTKPAANRSPGAVFSEMVDTAKAFAGRVKGEAIAPNHDDLSQEDVDQIRQSIEKVAEEMEEQGMTPGSDEAMRIF